MLCITMSQCELIICLCFSFSHFAHNILVGCVFVYGWCCCVFILFRSFDQFTQPINRRIKYIHAFRWDIRHHERNYTLNSNFSGYFDNFIFVWAKETNMKTYIESMYNVCIVRSLQINPPPTKLCAVNETKIPLPFKRSSHKKLNSTFLQSSLDDDHENSPTKFPTLTHM